MMSGVIMQYLAALLKIHVATFKNIDMVQVNNELNEERLQFIEYCFFDVCLFTDTTLFMALCKKYGVEIDERTEYLLQTFIVAIAYNGDVKFIRPDGVKKYRLDKCHEIGKRLYVAIAESRRNK